MGGLPFDLFAANQSPIAETALKHIAALYALEAEAKESTPEIRQGLRKQVCEKLTKFHVWLTGTRIKVAPGSGTAKAMDYTLKRWPALIRYAETGNLIVDPIVKTVFRRV